MNDYMEVIRGQIYHVAEKNDWSILKISIVCNLSYECIKGILYKKSKDISLHTLMCLSEGLKIPVGTLVDREE